MAVKKQLTITEMNAKIKALDEKITKTTETLAKYKADKRALEKEKADRQAGKTTVAKKTTAAKKATTAAKKTTTAKKTTAKKTTARKTTKKEEEDKGLLGNVLGDLMNNKDIKNALGDLLGGK